MKTKFQSSFFSFIFSVTKSRNSLIVIDGFSEISLETTLSSE